MSRQLTDNWSKDRLRNSSEAKLPFEVLFESNGCSIDEAEQGHTDQGPGLRGQDTIISRHLSNNRRVGDNSDLLL